MASSAQLTDAEKQAVAQLKERMDCIWATDDTLQQSDWTLVRFLRARKGSMEDAFLSLMKFVEWLQTPDYGVKNVAEISRANCGDFPERGVCGLLEGNGKDGRPVMYVEPSRHDASGRDLDEWTRFVIFRCKEAEARLEAAPAEVHQYTVLVNMNGFEVGKNMDYKGLKRTFYILDNFFPERLARAMIVNAPLAFRACWAVIYPWLDSVTQQKISFVDLPAVYEIVDKSVLPSHLVDGGDVSEITSNTAALSGAGKE
eukprot:Hpha_TRINITY_DN34777_c0_g1::TRINITY_DN34777_c0_g1_i1::g.178054::m.178054